MVERVMDFLRPENLNAIFWANVSISVMGLCGIGLACLLMGSMARKARERIGPYVACALTTSMVLYIAFCVVVLSVKEDLQERLALRIQLAVAEASRFSLLVSALNLVCLIALWEAFRQYRRSNKQEGKIPKQKPET